MEEVYEDEYEREDDIPDIDTFHDSLPAEEVLPYLEGVMGLGDVLEAYRRCRMSSTEFLKVFSAALDDAYESFRSDAEDAMQCPACGGSGGGLPPMRCPTCWGTGKRR